MNKILNWTFGACFRTLGRFLAIFLILALFLFIGSKLDIELPDWLRLRVNASTITSYDATFSTSNRYYYSTSNTLQNNSLGVIGNVYSGKSYNFTFYLNTSSLTAQSTYDITINANSNDFTKNLNSSSIYIKTSNSTDFTNSTNGISLISFTNTATSSKNSNKIVLRIYVNSLTSYTMIDIFNSNYANITSVSNFGIKSLSIEQVDTSGNNEIIENDKNNTQNIINNNNQNTQDIIDNVNNQLNSCSIKETKIYYYDKVITNKYLDSNGNQIDDVGSGISDYISIKQNTEYNIHLTNDSFNAGSFCLYDVNKTLINCEAYSKRVDVNFNSNNAYYFRTSMTILASNPTTLSYNSCTNKIDDLNNSINDTNNIISDNTSPDVSGMTDLAGYLPPGPLDSVLNLPLSILNSLNSKLSSSCTPLSLTLPFVNLPLNIPCLSTIFSQINGLNVIWESIGVILGALIMYSYLTYLYNWVDDITSLRHNKARLFGAKSDADNWGGV